LRARLNSWAWIAISATAKRIVRKKPNDALEAWEVLFLLRAAGLVAG
jgi:hypothetical protein